MEIGSITSHRSPAFTAARLSSSFSKSSAAGNRKDTEKLIAESPDKASEVDSIYNRGLDDEHLGTLGRALVAAAKLTDRMADVIKKVRGNKSNSTQKAAAQQELQALVKEYLSLVSSPAFRSGYAAAGIAAGGIEHGQDAKTIENRISSSMRSPSSHSLLGESFYDRLGEGNSAAFKALSQGLGVLTYSGKAVSDLANLNFYDDSQVDSALKLLQTLRKASDLSLKALAGEVTEFDENGEDSVHLELKQLDPQAISFIEKLKDFSKNKDFLDLTLLDQMKDAHGTPDTSVLDDPLSVFA